MEEGTLKLLAIDDSPDNLELVSEALQQKGVEIHTAETAEAGMELFCRLRPRVVLLDLVIPRVKGLELLERMVAADPGVDVILMTGHYSTESAVEAIQKGASDYMNKPLDLQKLRNKIAGLLAEVELRQKTLKLDSQLVDTYQFDGIVGRSVRENPARVAALPDSAGNRSDGHWKGIGRALAARAQPGTRGKICSLQLRGTGRHAAGKRVVRSRAGCIHWSDPGQAGAFRICERRHGISG
jgi:CheY-like chemotaxis protein